MIKDLPSKVRSRIFSELSACHVPAAADVPSFLGRDSQETVEVLGEGELLPDCIHGPTIRLHCLPILELYNLSDDVSDDFYQDPACHSTGMSREMQNILNYKEASIYLEVSKLHLNYFIILPKYSLGRSRF